MVLRLTSRLRRVGRTPARRILRPHVPVNPRDPVLPGPGSSDYERYLRTDELLSLQSQPNRDLVHRDELLFMVVHQSSELWLKLAWNEVAAANDALEVADIHEATRLLRRGNLALVFVTDQVEMLEQLVPWEYTRDIRPELGHGSGFDSPGFKALRKEMARLYRGFNTTLESRNLTIIELYTNHRGHPDVYTLAELLTDLDGRLQTFRFRHYKSAVERVIGSKVVGTQGTPVELLSKLIEKSAYPELVDVRTDLTNLAIKGQADEQPGAQA